MLAPLPPNIIALYGFLILGTHFQRVFLFLGFNCQKVTFNLQMKALLILFQTHLFLTALVPVAVSNHTHNRRQLIFIIGLYFDCFQFSSVIELSSTDTSNSHHHEVRRCFIFRSLL